MAAAAAVEAPLEVATDAAADAVEAPPEADTATAMAMEVALPVQEQV